MHSHQETMTPRERVLAAIEHREPDRVPIDLGGNQTGIHRVAYEALLKTLGLEEEIVILDPVQQLAQPSEAVLQRLRVDTRYIRAGAGEGFDGKIETNVRDGKVWHDLIDEFGVRWSMPDDAPLYMDITHHPLAEASIDDIDRYPFPRGNDAARFVGLREEALRIRGETPYALVTGISGVVYETCWYLRGLEQWFMDLVEQPRFCEELLERTLLFWLQWFDGFLNEVGDLVDVIMIGDDLAGQNGPLFNPKVYREIVQPRQRRLVQSIKGTNDRQDLVSHVRGVQMLHSRPAGQRRRYLEPGPDQRCRHESGGIETRVRRSPSSSGAAGSIRKTSCRQQMRPRFANTSHGT